MSPTPQKQSVKDLRIRILKILIYASSLIAVTATILYKATNHFYGFEVSFYITGAFLISVFLYIMIRVLFFPFTVLLSEDIKEFKEAPLGEKLYLIVMFFFTFAWWWFSCLYSGDYSPKNFLNILPFVVFYFFLAFFRNIIWEVGATLFHYVRKKVLLRFRVSSEIKDDQYKSPFRDKSFILKFIAFLWLLNGMIIALTMYGLSPEASYWPVPSLQGIYNGALLTKGMDPVQFWMLIIMAPPLLMILEYALFYIVIAMILLPLLVLTLLWALFSKKN